MCKNEKEMGTWGNNLANYYEMSKPHEDAQALNKAFTEFFDDLKTIRERHKIADVLIVIGDTFKKDDNDIQAATSVIRYGDESHGLPMAAYALGKMKFELKEKINEMISDAE
jgi:hypothetical protein